MSISFTSSEIGLTVSDRIEQRQCLLTTPEPVEYRPSDSDRFVFPVDNTIAVETDRFTLTSGVATYVRNANGEMQGEIEHMETREFPEGQYDVELCAPIKLYLRVQGPLTIASNFDAVEINAGGSAIHVGARSHHKQPEETITTTGDPRDLMDALSAFSSALKTTSPERSFPSLRGHPPEVRLGEELSIPTELEPPETGITLELPATRSSVYPAASLAYYLGAQIEPGVKPRIVTDEDFIYELGTDDSYERDLERVLKQTFFLDCLVRTEGYYQVDLQERIAVERDLDLDFARLYDLSLAERLEEYLKVPYDTIADEIPKWKLTTHVAPTAEHAELLPFLVDDLAIIRLPQSQRVTATEKQTTAISDFTRDFTRSAAGTETVRATAATTEAPALVELEETESFEQAWAGEDVPLNASKVSIEAFRNGLDREETNGNIDITVVCNDDAMDAEQDLAADVYGSRDELPFDVEIYHNLTTTALQAVIETDSDFLHYIGHIDENGFACTDGRLDVRNLDAGDVGVDAFFLNACTSYEQGMALIERGAIGGVVTLADVLNSGAVRVGQTMVRLLNQGFPLRAALKIAEDRSIVGGQYIVVGDGNTDIVQSDGGPPILIRAERQDGGFHLTARVYPAGIWQLGAMCQLMVDNSNCRFLVLGEMEVGDLPKAELLDFLSLGNAPVIFDDEFYWAEELTE